MSQLIRPLRQWPRLPHRPSLPLLFSPRTTTHLYTTTLLTPSSRHYVRQRGLGFTDAPPPDVQRDESDEEGSDGGKSRNQKKREARRAVRWGMDLASLSLSKMKRVLRVVSLEEDVLEALMLVKKLGPDVKEGKRRQFNYIGKLLREAEPELMDALIQTAKDDDPTRLQALSASEAWARSNNVIDDDDYMGENELDEEDYSSFASIADRWFNGLIDNNVEITREVYSIRDVDFDRQELRKLVRLVQSSQERPSPTNEVKVALKAQKSLLRLLCSLAKQYSSETNL